MVRPREFDEGQVLEAAVRRFRRHGVARTSIRDLETATGLTNGSIYNSFGGKDGLLAAALAHYAGIGAERRRAHFERTLGIQGLETLFVSLLDAPDCDTSGCLITNVAVELGGDPGRPEVAGEMAALTAEFRRQLERDLAADRVEAAAARLLMLYQGLLVLIRARHPRAACETAIADEFRALRDLATRECDART